MPHAAHCLTPRARPAWVALLLTLLVLGAGCAFTPPDPIAAAPTPSGEAGVRACQHWYGQLDAAIDRAGVRDAGATTVPGHPFLRIDRFHASLRDLLPASPDAASSAPVRAALMARLLALDLQARRHEIANLPHDGRLRLAEVTGGPADARALQEHTRVCGQALASAALARPAQAHALLHALAVPPDYVPAYRVFGLYPLTRIPFLYGVRRFEDQVRASFRQDPAADATMPRQRLVPPWRPDPAQVTPAQLRAMVQPAPGDPLGIPAPSAAQLDTLFAHFAPTFDLGLRSQDDRTGALAWPARSASAGSGTPVIRADQPVVYRQVAWTRHGQASLLQLVYTIWFGGRPATSWPIDLLAGRLDGLVWRVTLSPQGIPVMYDSIHPCGCYHQFFPPPWVQMRPAPDPHTEWAFSPAPVPVLAPGQSLVLHVAPTTHYLDGLRPQTHPTGTPYAWRDYDLLRSLPGPDGTRRGVFDADGFIPGTGRAEAWLFWPMGIERAGAMRQWGRHATAFVGQRHFDDARLLDQRFVLESPPRDD